MNDQNIFEKSSTILPIAFIAFPAPDLSFLLSLLLAQHRAYVAAPTTIPTLTPFANDVIFTLIVITSIDFDIIIRIQTKTIQKMLFKNKKYDILSKAFKNWRINMENIQKVCAINDVSGIGRCSLTVIIPVLSYMGIQVCPVPTAVFSAHTGYDEFVKKDLTDYLGPALDYYKRMNVRFDSVYSGFLGSEQQIDCVLDFLKSNPDSLKLVDPVMGDNGKPYKTVTQNHILRMSELVKVADMITPNITEAAILLKEKYPDTSLSSDTVKDWAQRLSDLGPGKVVITSVELFDNMLCNVGYDDNEKSFFVVPCQYVPAHYSGSGDMFASILAGGLLKGESLKDAVCRATGFTELAIKTTYECKNEPLDGILLESCLSELYDENTPNRCIEL